jgi:adenosylcobyric acid synthase
MLGRTISDPEGVEGVGGTVAGLGLLDVETVLTGDKVLRPVNGTHCATGERATGYEIHLGRTSGPDCARPMLDIDGRPDGASSADGRVAGTYVHGLFAADAFRRAYVAGFGVASTLAYENQVERALDTLADHLERHLDLDRILAIARTRRTVRGASAS